MTHRIILKLLNIIIKLILINFHVQNLLKLNLKSFLIGKIKKIINNFILEIFKKV